MADALNSTHGIPGFVHFEIGESGLTKAVLSNPSAGSKLEVYPYGMMCFIFKLDFPQFNWFKVLTYLPGPQSMENRFL